MSASTEPEGATDGESGSSSGSSPATKGAVSLRRVLTLRDGVLLTIGSTVGTGIFLTAGDVARAAPRPDLVLAVWLAAGGLSLAGALVYAELGTMFPRAGGIYHFVREAWGSLPAFLYGWTCLLVIMTGGIAAVAVGFGEYLGALVPLFSSGRVVFALGSWSVNGAQLAAALAIVGLTTVNHFGVRLGAAVQNLFTLAKVGAIAALVAVAWRASTHWPPLSARPPVLSTAALSLALVAALWTYDGWYAATFAAGEMRHPERDLPRALVLGVAAVVALYSLLNVVYLRALTIDQLAAAPRAAEAAAQALAGPRGARLVAAAVAVSAFGCLGASILYASRLYGPMAEDGVFPRLFARLDPRWRTPVAALWLQGGWGVALALTGGYTALFTYVTFGSLLFHLLGGLAHFRLRATRPAAPRPYRTHGSPWVPLLFVGSTAALAAGALVGAPRESLLGLLAIAAGLPAYLFWRARARRRRGGEVTR